MIRGLAVAVLLCLAMLGQSAPLPQVHRFELADCDDVAFGPDGDLYFACHSSQDRLPIEVRGAKSTPDEMDAYVLRFMSLRSFAKSVSLTPTHDIIRNRLAIFSGPIVLLPRPRTHD